MPAKIDIGGNAVPVKNVSLSQLIGYNTRQKTIGNFTIYSTLLHVSGIKNEQVDWKPVGVPSKGYALWRRVTETEASVDSGVISGYKWRP